MGFNSGFKGLILRVHGGEWSAPRPGPFIPEEMGPGTR